MHGACFTFNYFPQGHNNSFPVQEVEGPGNLVGLEVTLNLGTEDNPMKGIQEQDGIRVILHHPEQMPLTGSQGYWVRPNTLTQLAVKEHTTHRQPAPYPSNCTESWEDDPVFAHHLSQYPYSIQLCHSFCLDQYVRDTCNCSLTLINEIYSWIRPPCDLSVDAEFACVMQIGSRLKGDIELCGCRPECEETRYKVDLSAGLWPSSMGFADVAEEFNVTYR